MWENKGLDLRMEENKDFENLDLNMEENKDFENLDLTCGKTKDLTYVWRKTRTLRTLT